MAKTKLRSVILMLIATVLIPFGQILFKMGADKLDISISGTVLNWPLYLGIGLYAFSAVMVTFALKGGELSVLYPIIATSFIWVFIMSAIVFNEPVTAVKVIGIISIIAGISSIGVGAG